MMSDTRKLRSTIQSLGMSRLRLWMARLFGEVLQHEFVDGFDVQYVKWLGVDHTIVRKKEPE